MRKVRHVDSFKTALCKPARSKGWVLLQFDDPNHPHSIGWHLYFETQIEYLDKE
jgi:hypothetical protein